MTGRQEIASDLLDVMDQIPPPAKWLRTEAPLPANMTVDTYLKIARDLIYDHSKIAGFNSLAGDVDALRNYLNALGYGNEVVNIHADPTLYTILDMVINHLAP